MTDSAFDAAPSDLERWLLPNPFLSAPEPARESRFVLDEQAFMAALAEPAPLFLQAPGEDYLRAVERLGSFTAEGERR